MLKALTLAAVLVLSPAAIAHAQSNATPEQLVDAYFQDLKKGDVALAYKRLWGGTMMEQKQADVNFAVKQTEVALQSFGPVSDWELMSEEVHSPSYKVRIYLLRLENGPLFFKMKLYRRPKGWMVYGLDFRDSFDALS